MAASLVSEHMRQSPVADTGPELAALSSESLLESDMSPLWSASSPMTSTTESLSKSMVLPEASTANLSLGLGAILTILEGRLMSSGAGCLEMWLATGWMGRVLCPLLMLSSLVPA